jgi:hypothetical protein
MFALAIIPLLACAALAGDTGLLYWEKAQLQNGADAGALAVADDCVKFPALCEGRAVALATDTAGDNANDGTSEATIPAITVNSSSGSVTVVASSPPGDGVEHPFASVLVPQDATTLQARAIAQWGTPIKGTTEVALTIAECEFDDLPPQDPDATNPTRTWLLINGGSGSPCANGAPGGFGWLDGVGCQATVAIDATVGGEVGVQPNPNKNGCSADVLAQKLCETLLIPLYTTTTGSGANATFTISRFAAFKLTGVKTGGANSDEYCGGVPLSPPVPAPVGNSKGIQGYFVKYVELGEDFELGTGPSGGLTVIRLAG